MRVLIVKNVMSEGPGTIAEYLAEARVPSSVIEYHGGVAAPALDPFTHVVIMGGPMAVYEMDRYPHLAAEAKLIEESLRTNKHVLGVCLGAQMVAHVLGARVYAGQQKEIGWYEVALTDEGMADPALSRLALAEKKAARVFQWHGDTFDLPRGAVGLASSNLYPNQAFRYADRVYALQFHIEVTPGIVSGWLAAEKDVDVPAVDAESNRIYPDYRERAWDFYRRFFVL